MPQTATAKNGSSLSENTKSSDLKPAFVEEYTSSEPILHDRLIGPHSVLKDVKVGRCYAYISIRAAYHRQPYMQPACAKCVLPQVFELETQTVHTALRFTEMLPHAQSAASSTHLFDGDTISRFGQCRTAKNRLLRQFYKSFLSSYFFKIKETLQW